MIGAAGRREGAREPCALSRTRCREAFARKDGLVAGVSHMVKYSQTTEKKGSVEMKGIRAAVLALGGAFLLAGMRWGERRSGAHPGRGLLSGGVRRTGGELDGLGGGGRVGTHAEQHTSGATAPRSLTAGRSARIFWGRPSRTRRRTAAGWRRPPMRACPWKPPTPRG